MRQKCFRHTESEIGLKSEVGTAKFYGPGLFFLKEITRTTRTPKVDVNPSGSDESLLNKISEGHKGLRSLIFILFQALENLEQ
jgi:hypothetical protein